MENDFSLVNQVCEVKDPLTWTPEKNRLMVQACRSMAEFHYQHCPEIRALYDKYGFKPASLVDEQDLTRIPPLGVTAMKYFLLTSLPHQAAVLKLTSSGTRGQKTQIWFDQDSLDRVQRMLDVYLEQEHIVSGDLTNYLVFNYDPDQAQDLGVAYSDKNQLRFAPQNEVFYCVKKNAAGDWHFLKEEAYETLLRYQKDGKPVRIFAMPVFLHEFIMYLRERKQTKACLALPKGSLIITGGGWKASEDKMISREQFRRECAVVFGIPEEWIRDAYGMAEHSAPYFHCRKHRFHVAVFNRLYIRDPESLRVLPDGEPGLLELVTPFNAMMPTLAILSTDWALIDKESCGCGFNAPTFTLLGRAGLVKQKGCALHADEIVKRG